MYGSRTVPETLGTGIRTSVAILSPVASAMLHKTLAKKMRASSPYYDENEQHEESRHNDSHCRANASLSLFENKRVFQGVPRMALLLLLVLFQLVQIPFLQVQPPGQVLLILLLLFLLFL